MHPGSLPCAYVSVRIPQTFGLDLLLVDVFAGNIASERTVAFTVHCSLRHLLIADFLHQQSGRGTSLDTTYPV